MVYKISQTGDKEIGLKGIIYEVQIYMDMMAFHRGHLGTILELYIPEFNIAVNEITVFVPTAGRYEPALETQDQTGMLRIVGEIEVDDGTARRLLDCAEYEKRHEEAVEVAKEWWNAARPRT